MRYTASTYIFKTLKEAERKVQEWNDENSLNSDTKIFEITENIYKPVLKLVKEKNENTE